jgi:hypothetical protein
MSRLTGRLPGTLHDQLTTLAKREGISLNQYIVYALTRQVTLAYTVQAVPEQARLQQRASYTALLQSLKKSRPCWQSERKLSPRKGWVLKP